MSPQAGTSPQPLTEFHVGTPGCTADGEAVGAFRRPLAHQVRGTFTDPGMVELAIPRSDWTCTADGQLRAFRCVRLY
jgi:hypothetical protein